MANPLTSESVLTEVLHHAADGGSTPSLLQRVADGAVTVLGGPETVAVVLGAPETGFSVHARAPGSVGSAGSVGSPPAAGLLLGGPVLTTAVTGAMTTAVDLARSGGRWPEWADAALTAGIRGVRCWPVRVAGRPAGALVALTAQEWDAVPRPSAAGQALADLCAVALQLPPEEQRWENAAAHLHSALVVDVVIHQAVGMVSAALGTDIPGAATALTAHAGRLDLTVDELARRIVERTVPAREVPLP